MKKLIVNNDIEILLETIKGIDKNKTIIVLFTGSKDSAGISWCPDCNDAEPALKAVFKDQKESSDNLVFITVNIDRNIWKDPKNGFRTHKDFRVKCVPTLINLKNSRRLEESQICDQQLVEMLLED